MESCEPLAWRFEGDLTVRLVEGIVLAVSEININTIGAQASTCTDTTFRLGVMNSNKLRQVVIVNEDHIATRCLL